MIRLVTAASVCLVAPLSVAQAQQFPTFSTDLFNGWIEDTGNATGRIVVYPILAAPGIGAYWAKPEELGVFSPVDPYAPAPYRGLDYTADGRLQFGYRILRDARYLPADLKSQISTQSGIPLSRLGQYTVTFVDPKDIASVSLDLAGQQFTHDLGAHNLSNNIYEGTFYIPISAAAKDALRKGQFTLSMLSKLPNVTLSSINFNLSASAVTSSWIKAYREVTKKTRRSGFNAGFIDFSKAVQRVRVEEDIRGSTSTNIDSNITAVLRNPTPEQTARFEKLFGFAQISVSEMLTNHRAAHAAAMLAGSLNLAGAHEQYIKEIEANAPGNSDKLLEALTKLTDDQALKFMMSGVKASFGGTSTSYKYSGFSSTESRTTLEQSYNEYLIQSVDVLTTTASAGFSVSGAVAQALKDADRRAHSRNFQTTSYLSPANAQEWARGTASAVQRESLGDVQYSFDLLTINDFLPPAGKQEIVDPNASVNVNGETLLHYAVSTGNPALVELLIRNGSDPLTRDKFGETALARAQRLGKHAILPLLDAAAQKTGTATFDISHPGISIIKASFGYPSAPGAVTLNRPGEGRTELVLKGRPQRSWARIWLDYEVRVPANQAYLIQFPHQGSVSGTSYVARARTWLLAPYSIAAGENFGVTAKVENGGAAGYVAELVE
ncbi:MAG TPA: ankyrin repeat domain-containing protein [Allosphingosinicella sp.]|nr:ankyrin repeat domain-containing protein [Allosphingosinicella sp.]